MQQPPTLQSKKHTFSYLPSSIHFLIDKSSNYPQSPPHNLGYYSFSQPMPSDLASSVLPSLLPFFHLLHQSVHHLITFLVNLMHTLFALEDIYGLKVKNVEGQPHLFLDASISAPGSSADEMLRAWMEQADKLENGEISKEEYDKWRYKYPELDTYQKRVKVPSLKLSNYFVQELPKKK